MTSRWEWPEPEMSLGQWLGICWETLGRGAWKPPTRGQLALAQVLEQPHLDRACITGFRGMGKSVVTAAAVTWFWRFISPNIKALVISAGHDKAKDFSFQVKKLLDEVPELEHLRPSGARGMRQEIDAFDIAGCVPEQSRSLRSYGLEGKATGGRADIIIMDDVEVPENTYTQHMREKSWGKVQEYFHMLKPKSESPSKMVDLGTPHTEDSLHNRLVSESGFRRFLYPARYPDLGLQEHMGRDLHPVLRKDLAENPDLVGQPTDPDRFSEAELAHRQGEVPAREWQLQFMLDTRVSDADRYPLKINDLMVMDLDDTVGPEQALYARTSVIEDLSRDFCIGWDGDRFHSPMNLQDMRFKDYQHKMLFVDPSGRGQDETAYTAVGFVNGYLCIFEVGGLKEGFTDSTLDHLLKVAQRWKCSGIVVEDNFGNGMYTKLLTGHIRSRKASLGVEDVTVKGRKEERIIQTLRPLLEKHRVIVNRSVVTSDYLESKSASNSSSMATKAANSFFYQMSRLTEEKGCLRHDDRVDAVSLAAAFYQDMMAVEAVDAMARDERRNLRERSKQIDAHNRGRGRKGGGKLTRFSTNRFGFKRSSL